MERGGLTAALAGAGLRAGREAWHSDELRLGLRGRTRRVLAPRGVKVVQPLQLQYEWSYLLLGVEPLSGQLRWAWIERMRQAHIKPVLEHWGLECVVWDGAGGHRGQSLAELPTQRVLVPAYSPELNPAERVFQGIRGHVEGKVYPSLAAKQQEAESYLEALKADPERVRSLCGWQWLRDALAALPPHTEDP